MTDRKKKYTGRISLASQGSRKQFDAAIAIITIIPLLVLTALIRMDKMREAMGVPSFILLITGLVLLMVMGYVMLSRYPATVIKLRKHLEDIAHGEMPSSIHLFQDENDIRAIEKGMNFVLERLKAKVKDAEDENIELQKEIFNTRKLEAVGSLATGIAHEVSTPLQYVSSNVTFLSKCVEDCFQCLEEHSVTSSSTHTAEDIAFLKEELPQCIEQTREGIQRIAGIIKALKDFSRKGSDENKSLADINASIQNIVEISRNNWKHIADMELNLDSALQPITCYPGDIKQAVMSVLSNAIDAIAAQKAKNSSLQGQISITTSQQDGDLRIKITDNGCGIPEEDQHRIFDPFFTTQDVGKGVGQGLPMAFFSVVRRHNGSITFESRTDEGSSFLISIPASIEDESAA